MWKQYTVEFEGSSKITVKARTRDEAVTKLRKKIQFSKAKLKKVTLQ